MTQIDHSNIVEIAEVSSFLEQYSFATIVYSHNNKNYALQVPFLLNLNNTDGKLALYACIDLGSSIQQLVDSSLDVLCIFNGPHGYISPSWAEALTIPQWSFKTIHINGVVKPVATENAKDLTEKMMQYFESIIEKPINDIQNNSINATAILAEKQLIEIDIIKVIRQDKLCQEIDEKSYLSIIRELKRQSDFNAMLIAFEMEQELKKMRRTKS